MSKTLIVDKSHEVNQCPGCQDERVKYWQVKCTWVGYEVNWVYAWHLEIDPTHKVPMPEISYCPYCGQYLITAKTD